MREIFHADIIFNAALFHIVLQAMANNYNQSSCCQKKKKKTLRSVIRSGHVN